MKKIMNGQKLDTIKDELIVTEELLLPAGTFDSKIGMFFTKDSYLTLSLYKTHTGYVYTVSVDFRGSIDVATQDDQAFDSVLGMFNNLPEKFFEEYEV